MLPLTLLCALLPVANASRWEIVATESIPGESAELQIQIVAEEDSQAVPSLLPARVIITDSAGKHVDGSGRGVYADGRFFTPGKFSVTLPPGETKLTIHCGPHRIPLEQSIVLKAGERVQARATIKRWLDPFSLGWYSGDNHVHTQHDKQTAIRVDSSYTALQAQANDLAFITEADANISAASVAQYDTPRFLYRTAPEIRIGPFVGHVNTPGIQAPLATDRYERLIRRPLPRIAVHDAIRELGGVMIHTHPLTPPHQLHWMGAAEAWCDAAVGRCADLIDIDSPQSEQLWFAILNLNNRVACSSYTDCALGRLQTASPGDRRVYCQAEKFDYAAIVQSMRQGRTVATNGGPLLVTAKLASGNLGDTITWPEDETRPLKVTCYSLLPLKKVQCIRGGLVVKEFTHKDFSAQGPTSTLELSAELASAPGNWLIVKAENTQGDWAITSPIYIESPKNSEVTAAAVLAEISNHTRFVELRRDYFLHVLAAVRPPEAIQEVRILRDQTLVAKFRPEEPEQWAGDQTPVTGNQGEYQTGWAWHREGEVPCHLQADWPMKESGWYSVEISTSRNRCVKTEQAHFDAAAKQSHAISWAKLEGPNTLLTLHGYGEEMPHDEIKTPFVGDHWWYPRKTYWHMQAQKQGQSRSFLVGDQEAVTRFRTAE